MINAEVITGDCLEVMREIADGSIDACVTDPPYGLSFMGKHWDYQIPSVEMFREIYRTLKDGSRLLCFGGTRTMHRMWCNIEDAGFTIEDSIMWLYGSGFPKHKSKLKPAYEPVCVARKGSVSALNIDECRIEYEDTPNPATNPLYRKAAGYKNNSASDAGSSSYSLKGGTGERNPNSAGRWPANIVLDEVAAQMLDEQSGTLTSGTGGFKRNSANGYLANAYGRESRAAGTPNVEYGDSGGASRFLLLCKSGESGAASRT